MDFEEWEPLYQEILDDFGFSRGKDEESARILEKITNKSKLIEISQLKSSIGREVTICGNGASLKNDLEKNEVKGTLISAGPSTSVLLNNGLIPDIFVTDLDGRPDEELEASALGSLGIIHAHGDNIPLIKKYVPKFVGRILITTQSRPFNLLNNFGGFTDGDRAVMMVRSFNVNKITLIGFDFNNPIPKIGTDPRIKARKLMWAKKLIFEFNNEDVEIDFI